MRLSPLSGFIAVCFYYNVALAGGGDGMGITSPPCGIYDPIPGCAYTEEVDCEGAHPNYKRAVLLGIDERIDIDLDILYSESFEIFAAEAEPPNPSWIVEEFELEELAFEIDGNDVNPLGTDYQTWDLALVWNFYTQDNALYGDAPSPSNFIFTNTLGGLPQRERDHIDLYLVPAFEVDDVCNPSFPGTCCAMAAGLPDSRFRDDDEDPPFVESCPSSVPEFLGNSLQIWDHNGNRDDVEGWPAASAVTFDHEFEHKIQIEKTGQNDLVGLGEFFASGAEYLGNPVYPEGTGELEHDICYDNTVHNEFGNYQIWRTWGVYLLQHFRNGPGIADDLMRTWNRTVGRDFKYLANVLEGSAYDGAFGCASCPAGYKGQSRLEALNNRVAVARWVNETEFSSGGPVQNPGYWGYLFGFDPGRDVGLYRKIASANCNWTHSVPPVHQLGSGNFSTTVVQCYEDPRDTCPACTPGFCHAASVPGEPQYCGDGCGDKIDLFPWGADVIGFVGDNTFSDGNYYELKMTFNTAAMPSDCTWDLGPPDCSYRFYINVITYNTNDTVTELWDRGDWVTSISTYGPFFPTAPREIEFTIGDFGCPLVRSAAFIVSLADSVKTNLSGNWDSHKRFDYSYSYRVVQPTPPPGYVCPTADPMCPFVFVETGGGLLLDNNILSEGGWYSDRVPEEADVTDEYVLSREALLRDGRVRLEIREDGHESSYLDAVQLMSIPASGNTRIVRLPNEGLRLISPGDRIDEIRDSEGRDVSLKLSSLDGDRVDGIEGYHVTFEWTKTANIGPQLIVVDPLLKQPPPGGWGERGAREISGRGGIVLQALDGVEWTDIAEFVPRERGESQAVDTALIPGRPGDLVRLRLLWKAHHQLDAVGFGHSQEFEDGAVVPLTPIQMSHSTRGDVRGGLEAMDGDYEVLNPGERISLVFNAEAVDDESRFCLVTRGHYLMPLELTEGDGGYEPRIGLKENAIALSNEASVTISAYPNPSRSSTTIEMSLVAHDDVEVSIYSVDGHLVKRLHRGMLEPGVKRFMWDGKNEHGSGVATGQYFYQIASAGGDWTRTGKLFVIK